MGNPKTKPLIKQQLKKLGHWQHLCWADPKINFLMLDELTYMFNHGWLDLDMVTEAISQRPAHMNLVITGRGAPDGLIAACDTVSEVKDIKHAFRNGIKAQRGIEF